MAGRDDFPLGSVSKIYTQTSIQQRLEAFFIDNVGRIVTRDMLIQVARDPITGKEPENWHQRLSELRTDSGYTILSKRDRSFLAIGEYLLQSTQRRVGAGKRVLPTKQAWADVLNRAGNCCEWNDSAELCRLREGELDPIGGGTVKLTPDHIDPHSLNPNTDPSDPTQWQALCGRHQVMKKNYWNSATGKVNTQAIIQAAPHEEKRLVYTQLREYFGYEPDSDS
ncbi:restriction endonuclease [Shewanella baltica]|uniref:HNH endonuclease n=1 Tax=Shewanella baltica TaxID=62322 RepID=UPI0007B4CCFB|nr:HNH endonuclease [Shewanella baltica]KZK67759.1 restriction endonuclease [Shewanella baltica]